MILTDMNRKWEKINSKIIYENSWFKIYEDDVIKPDGKKGIYGFLERPLCNFIIAMDNNDCVYLINEFRYPLQKNILQLPAGGIDNRDIIEQAKKELFEETGIIATKWERLGGFYVAPGHETSYINVFLAQDLDISKLKTSWQENDEAILEIIKVTLPELRDMLVAGKIECGITIAALNLFFLKYPGK